MGMTPKDLVLHESSDVDAPGVGALVERELARLFAQLVYRGLGK